MSHERATIALMITLLAPLAVRADEGRIPIHASTSITQPGTYVVTRDFTGTIAVLTSGVTLDLGGHTITGPAGQAVVGIASAATRIGIRNGTLLNGGIGIYQTPSSGTVLSIEDVAVNGPTTAGIYVAGAISRVVIARSRVTSTESGIVVAGTAGSVSVAEIDDAVVQNVTADAIQITGVSARVRGCVVRSFGTPWSGIAIGNSSGALVTDNQVVGPGYKGIFLASTSAGALVRGNVVTGAGEHGIVAQGSRHVIERNQVEGSVGCGLSFASGTGSAYRENMLRGNTGGTACGPATDAGGNIL